MLQKVQKNLKELNMVSPGEQLLVGVSGGADSVCLLLVLNALKEKMGFSLEVVHVEHGIRGEESVADADFVDSLCQRLRVPCMRVSVDVPTYASETGMGIEEAARELRYRAFSRRAEEMGAKVALAHHMEDNAETILFQMVRGSSLTGLCGMQPMRTDKEGVIYIRPLLSIHRREIEDYLQQQGQVYCVDSTNTQLEYSRNLLRNVVMPQLEKLNPRAVEHIHETASSLGEMKDFLLVERNRYWDDVVEEGNRKIILNAKKLSALHSVMQKEILYESIAFVSDGKKDITSTHVASLLALCEGQSGKEIALPNDVVAKKDFEKVYLGLKSETIEDISKSEIEISANQLEKVLQTKETLKIDLDNLGERLCIRVFPKDSQTGEIPKKSYTKWFDYDKIKTGFCIRKRFSGDYFICDGKGHRKKLKQYFIDEKISSSKREQMWLLAQENLVLWLIGGRISEHLKITEETTTIIEVSYKGGKEHEC